jgi:hypothetical protein
MKGSDNPYPSILIAETVDPAAPAAGHKRLWIDTDHALKTIDSAGAVTAIGGAITTKDEGSTLYAAVTTLDFVGAGVTASGAGATTTVTIPGGGAGVTTVDLDLSADFTVANDSAWHDITGLTGIVLAAGTWIGIITLDTQSAGTIGPVFRVWDGTTTYAQAGWRQITISGATLSSTITFHMKPTVLGSSTTMAVAVLSDTAFVVGKYPYRGGITTAIASHVTFMKIA